jgi:small GTP-binding protein
MLQESKGQTAEVRESEIGDDRYTQVDNDVFKIEGYVQEAKEENGNQEGEIIEEETGDTPLKKGLKKYKVILLGDIGVGKSSLINRYVSNKFNAFGQASIGSVKIKKLKIDNETTVELSINDPVEEEKLGKYTKNYYKDAHGAIIVFDITNKQSFNNVKSYLGEIDSNAPRDISTCIIGNKYDLSSSKVVEKEDVQKIAGKCIYYEVSAKTGNNVSLAFEELASEIEENQKKEEKNPDKVLRGKDGRKSYVLDEKKKPKKKWC